MSSILEMLQAYPLRNFAAGEVIIEQGTSSGLLYFLREGAVEVVKDGVIVARASEPGAIFGDLSALLGEPHTAMVRAAQACSFFAVEQPRAFLEQNPQITLHLCELLARRLDALNKYLVDVKQQFSGEDHIGMVDDVLETLLHRHPRKRVRPRESTVRGAEIAD